MLHRAAKHRQQRQPHLRVYLTTQPRLRRSDTKAGVVVASPAAGTSFSSSMSDGRNITRVFSVANLRWQQLFQGDARWASYGCRE
jgi:hypothetical protein